MEGAKGIDRKVYGPYLLLLEPEQLAVLTMHRSAVPQDAASASSLQGRAGWRAPAPARATCRRGLERGSHHWAALRPCWPLPLICSVINAIVAAEDAGGGAFSSPGQARVTRLSLSIGKVRRRARRARQLLLDALPVPSAGSRKPPICALGTMRSSASCMRALWARVCCACFVASPQLGAARPPQRPPPCLRWLPTTALPLQAVEGQVNLEKLQQEAHLHNLKRKEVKSLYNKARGLWAAPLSAAPAWDTAPLWSAFPAEPALHAGFSMAKHQPPAGAPAPTLQGAALRDRLQQLRRADPGAQLSETDWQEWLTTGIALREQGEVLPLDPHDWFQVGGVLPQCGWW